MKKRGISLIVLIITIIVLIVLTVGIIFAAQNGDIFGNAKESTFKSDLTSYREQFIQKKLEKKSQALGNYNEASINATNNNAGDTTDIKYWIPSISNKYVDKLAIQSGELVYVGADVKEIEWATKLDMIGSVIQPPPIEIDTTLKTYFLGVNNQGRNITEIMDLTTGAFISEADTIPDASTSISNLYGIQTPTKMTGYIKYDNKVYLGEIDMTTGLTIPSTFACLYAPSGREGQTYSFDGDNDGTAETWYVLKDNGSTIDIIGPTFRGIYLGSEDVTISSPGDLNNDGEADTDIDKSIYSYNNAIRKINEQCEKVIENKHINIVSVRSIGYAEEPSLGNYRSDELTENGSGMYNGILKAASDTYLEDYMRLNVLGIEYSGSEDYWIAERKVSWFGEELWFCIEYGNSNPLFSKPLLCVGKDNVCENQSKVANVRPIVTIVAQ